MEFSQKTKDLLDRMDQVALRKEYIFEKEKIRSILIQAYKLFSLPMPEIVSVKDIVDKRLLHAAGVAHAAGAARVAYAASAARVAYAASAAGAAGAAHAARVAYAASAARVAYAASA